MNDFKLSKFEMMILETIRNSKDPAKALEIATSVLQEYLGAHEKEGKQ